MDPRNPNPEGAAPGSGGSLALAYFEFARRWQFPVTVETDTGVEAESTVEAVDAKRGRLTLAIPNAPGSGLEPDDEVALFLGLEDGRWQGRAVVQHFRDNRRLFVLTLPRELRLQDRRKGPRARDIQEVSVQVQVKEFSGESLRGSVMDLGEGGLLMRLERGRGTDGADALGEGIDLAVVTVANGGGTGFECQGRLIHLTTGRQGLLAGIRFRNLKLEARQWLEGYLGPRAKAPPDVLPPLVYAPEETESGEVPALAPDSAAAASRADALLRIKKRGRTVMLAMPEGEERLGLAEAMLGDGYGRVLAVDHLWQVGEALQGQAVHLVLIDGGVAEMGPVELASFIYFARGDSPCVTLFATGDPLRYSEASLKQAGVDRLIAKPLALPALLSLVEVELELRPREDVPAALLAGGTSSGRSKVLRRIRSVALVMPPGQGRDEVAALLHREGFVRVLPAGTIAELVRAVESTSLALVFIDWSDPQLQGLEIASFLEGQRFAGTVTTVLAAERPNPRFVEDARALGVAHVVVKPYPLDADFAKLLAAFLVD